MKFSSFSLEGPKGNNQDRILEPLMFSDGWVAAIADGVGGNAGGGIAAQAAIESVSLSINDQSIDARAIFDRACTLIQGAASQASDMPRMATTLSMVWVANGTAHAAHVGDTRIYHVRDNGLVTRTEDQTEVAQLLRDKVLTRSQAKRYPRRNVITSYLSASASFDLFESTFDVIAGDKIIFLTDGVYQLITKAKILDYINSSSTVEEATENVLENIIRIGAKDDSSLVMIDV